MAASYDKTTLSFYVDGMPDGSSPATLTPSSFGNGTWSAGAWLGSGWYVGNSGNISRPFSGALDEVRIWNIARSGREIAENANRELTGSEAGLVNYWRFNEGTGNLANDTAFADSVDTSFGTP